MSTRTLTCPVGTSAVDAAYDCTNTWLAVLSSAHIRVLRREDPSRSFHPHGVLQLDDSDKHVSSLAWAPPDQGPLLAAGTGAGRLMLWACDPTSPEPCWTRIARLQAGKASLRQLAFDPSSATHACTLAAACEDGFVRFFERNDRDPSHTAWEPCNSLRCSGAAGKPTCLSWHDIGDGAAHGTALPSLLLVGTSRGQAAVWWLRKETASWVKATDLPLAGDGEGTGPAHAGRPIAAAGLESVTSAAWGPALGRAHETVATASGSVVTLCTLRGTIDALEVRRSAVLPHDSPVWQVGWNPLGTWLACSTQRGQVCLWRPDFGGEWQLCNVVAGEAAMQE